VPPDSHLYVAHPTNTIQWRDNKRWRLVKLTIEATKPLHSLVLLSRTEGHADSHEKLTYKAERVGLPG